MKKILVMYARYGSGHKSIAEYVYNYIKNNNEDIEIKLLDMTDYANAFGKITVKFMDQVLYHRLNKVFDLGYSLFNHRLLTFYNNSIARKCYDNEKLRKVIQDFNPDITVSSLFFCSNIIHYYNQLGLINSKLLTIITDYSYHEFWIKNYKYETGFIVANDIVKKELVSRGVNEKKIYAYGLPLDISRINTLDEKDTILKRYNLTGTKKIYLFYGGSSSGSMYYYEYFKHLAKLNLNADVIFICGKNNDLKNKCEQFIKSNKITNIKVLGYTTDGFNLMKIASLVITKPGGATVTECLEMKVPMLLVPGVGGQERYNATFIVKNGYGIKARGLWTFDNWLKRLEKYPSLISKMEKELAKQKENNSIKKINDLVMKL